MRIKIFTQEHAKKLRTPYFSFDIDYVVDDVYVIRGYPIPGYVFQEGRDSKEKHLRLLFQLRV